MIITKRFYLLTLLSLSIHTVGFANEADWYSVEYIVFEHNALSNQSLEPWEKEPLALPSNAMSLNSLPNTKAFNSLSSNQKQLHGIYNRLTKLSSYTPIMHGGWLQPLKSKEKIKPVQIIHHSSNRQLEGTLTFHRGRFLHLNIDLQLSESPLLADNVINLSTTGRQANTLYRLKETRRIKTSHTHYFDHPRFGVLTIVEKIDSPEKPISIPKTIEQDKPLESKDQNESAQSTQPS